LFYVISIKISCGFGVERKAPISI
ncbi:uncharacterized protein METZ01_LOCUS202527, partial [marine metagenome]